MQISKNKHTADVTKIKCMKVFTQKYSKHFEENNFKCADVLKYNP